MSIVIFNWVFMFGVNKTQFPVKSISAGFQLRSGNDLYVWVHVFNTEYYVFKTDKKGINYEND